MSNLSFSPNTSVTVAVGGTSGIVTVAGTGHYLRFVNGGVGNAFVAFYEASDPPPVIVQTTAMMIPSGAIEIFSVASDTTRVVVIGDSTGTTLNVTRGEGQ